MKKGVLSNFARRFAIDRVRSGYEITIALDFEDKQSLIKLENAIAFLHFLYKYNIYCHTFFGKSSVARLPVKYNYNYSRPLDLGEG